MGQGPCTFKARDLKTAIKAARAAGLPVERVEIDKAGKIVIVAARSTGEASQANEWDEVYGEDRAEIRQ